MMVHVHAYLFAHYLSGTCRRPYWDGGDRARLRLPQFFGTAEQRTPNYVRHGTATLFAVGELLGVRFCASCLVQR